MNAANQIIIWIITLFSVPAGILAAMLGWQNWQRQKNKVVRIVHLIAAVFFAGLALFSLVDIVTALVFHQPI